MDDELFVLFRSSIGSKSSKSKPSFQMASPSDANTIDPKCLRISASVPTKEESTKKPGGLRGDKAIGEFDSPLCLLFSRCCLGEKEGEEDEEDRGREPEFSTRRSIDDAEDVLLRGGPFVEGTRWRGS